MTDPTGSAIAGAKVKTTNKATGAALDTVTNSIGGFSEVGLTAGQYDIAVTHPGFNTFKETGITLESSAVYTANVTLKLGSEAAAVTVEAREA